MTGPVSSKHAWAVPTLVLCSSLAPAPVGAAPLVFGNMCDASAAVALDATHFVAADDERDTLRVYDVGTLAQTFELNLTDYLGNRNDKGSPKEGDLEGAVRREDSIIWITSHGRNKDADEKVYRWRLFQTLLIPATEEAGPTLSVPASGPYARLHADLLAFGLSHPELGFAQAEPNAPKQGGLNIEGLADAGGDDLFIGFRSPLVEGKAIVLKLSSVGDLFNGANPAQLRVEQLLDLGTRGIRSMEKVSDHYLIVAGPPTEDDSALGTAVGFQLFSWDGETSNVTPVPVDWAGLNPEALFEIGQPPGLMVLSDDGTVKVNGVKCKDLANDADKVFRAMALQLP